MITVISPSKSLDFHPLDHEEFTVPRLLERSEILAERLRKKKVRDLRKLMSISEAIAELNVMRYEQWSTPFEPHNSKVALHAFTGDVYTGLDAKSLTGAQERKVNQHVRILSGLYGLLRPFDLIQPYRLEMGTKLKVGRKDDLYSFWGDQITDLLIEDIENSGATALINLASKEYFKALKTKKIPVPIIEIVFKEYRGDALKFVSFNAKKARGIMARYLSLKGYKKPESLQSFTEDGYAFDPELSNEKQYIFTR